MATGVLCILSRLFYVYMCLSNTRMDVPLPCLPVLHRGQRCLSTPCLFEVNYQLLTDSFCGLPSVEYPRWLSHRSENAGHVFKKFCALFLMGSSFKTRMEVI